MTQATTVADARPRTSRRRRVLAGIALVLACLTILLTTLAVWTHQVALNTNRFTNLVGNVVTDPAVTDPISKRISIQVVDALGIQERLEARLPDAIKPLAGALTAAVTETDRPAAPGRPPEPAAPGGPGRDAGLHPRPDRAAAARRNRSRGHRRRLSDARCLPGRGRRLDRAAVDGTDPGRRPAPRPDLARGPGRPRPAPRDRARRHASRRLRDHPADAGRAIGDCADDRSSLRPDRHPAGDPQRGPGRRLRSGWPATGAGCSSISASA